MKATRELPATLTALAFMALMSLLALLAGCTTSRPAAALLPSANTVGQHQHRHDHRTKQREPYTLTSQIR